MKLSIAMSTTFLLSTQARKLNVEFTGDCNISNVLAVTGDDLYEYISEDDAEEEIEELCQSARDRNSNPRKGAYNFEKINGKGWQFTSNFYDGGTYINEEYEPEEINFDDIYNNEAKDMLITYPDTQKTAEKNFADCEAQAVMCCWVQDRYDDGNGDGNCEEDDCKDADPADNTNVCYHELEGSAGSSHVAGGDAIYTLNDGEDEGDTHCHGFAWDKDEQSTDYRYRGNLLFYVSMYDHVSQRGYVREVPGAPMCACLEQMPVVEESDCTYTVVEETYSLTFRSNGSHKASITDVDVSYEACTNNELEDRYNELKDLDKTTSESDAVVEEHLVGNGNCDTAFDTWFEDKYGYTKN